MNVVESSLQALIEGQKQFQVPLYQREYTWTGPQLSQLWSDLLAQYELLIPDDSGKDAATDPSHFLGSMVLAPSPTLQAAGVMSFLVIDGQQRLTTLFLAICALRDYGATTDDTLTERLNDLYLLNKYAKGPSRYRLLPTQTDRSDFFACVVGDPSTAQGKIGNAYRFFSAQLTQPGPDNLPLDVDRMERVLRERVQFVSITTTQGDNVHRIFESLNDRGVRLTQADLLRNYVFMLLPTNADRIYQDVWLPMQESLTPAELETLVFVDLILRGYATVKRTDLYRVQQNRLRPLEGDEAAVEKEIKDLARRATYFKRIVRPDTESDPMIRTSLQWLDRWGASTTYPLLVHIFDLWDRGLSEPDDVAAALGHVESFLARRLIAGVSTNNLNRIFNALVPQIPPNMSIADGVQHALSGERKFWPSDKRLAEAARSRSFYFFGRQEQKMLIFQRLEGSYGHAEPVDWQKAKLSIEHIMPQTLTPDWRAELATGGEDPEAVHEELLHTLGNLTVTAYNGKLSNKSFERKKEILSDSNLALNKAIVPGSTWGRKEIQSRADELAERATAIWSAPLAGVSESHEGRDWSRLHAVLAALPFGAWTSYSDLATLIGSHQVPVGQHLATTPGVKNAHRVLSLDGSVSDGFRWPDAEDDRDVFEVLKAEGVKLGADNRADPGQRLGPEALAGLINEIFEGTSTDWSWKRLLRYLRHFVEAPDNRLTEDEARSLAIQEGYSPGGVAGFYRGNGSLTVDGSFRLLTQGGKQLYEENKYRLDA